MGIRAFESEYVGLSRCIKQQKIILLIFCDVILRWKFNQIRQERRIEKILSECKALLPKHRLLKLYL
jgi:hypothetical protein